MSGHRQAAVALHGLNETDRAAILAHLPAPDQSTLRDYLDELDALGFQSDGVEFAAPGATPASLEMAPAGMLFSILEHEPAVLVAQVLALQEWPWRSALLALYPSARRELIRAAAAAGAPAPARARFLRDALEAGLAGPSAVSAGDAWVAPALPARKWWRPWR